MKPWEQAVQKLQAHAEATELMLISITTEVRGIVATVSSAVDQYRAKDDELQIQIDALTARVEALELEAVRGKCDA